MFFPPGSQVEIGEGGYEKGTLKTLELSGRVQRGFKDETGFPENLKIPHAFFLTARRDTI
jgi:hypothetical protein